jgi:hypothetical protein
MTRQEYISQWNTLFTNYVSTTLKIIAGQMSQPEIGNEWKERLGALKFVLEGKDVCDVKEDLAQGIVTDETLNKTEKIYVEIGSFLIDISVMEDAGKEGLKELFRQFEHYRNQMTQLELSLLS